MISFNFLVFKYGYCIFLRFGDTYSAFNSYSHNKIVWLILHKAAPSDGEYMYCENESCLYKVKMRIRIYLSTNNRFTQGKKGGGGAREHSGAITFIKEYLPTEKQRGYAHFVPKSAIHDNSLVIMKEFRINTGLINPSVFKSKINPNAQIRSYRKY